ncbi:unnamed protein product [Rhizopus microsporus]
MPIDFNITFPHVPCHMLSIDIMDDTGEHSTGYSQDITKVRLDLSGKVIESGQTVKLGDHTKDAEKALQPVPECGSCYGATPLREDGCCHTCQDVREAYIKQGWGLVNTKEIEQCVREGWLEKLEKQSNEGCNVHGHLLVNKVRGNFHFAPGSAFQAGSMHIHDLQEYSAGAAEGHKFDMSHVIHKLRFGPDTKDQSEEVLAVTNALAGTVKDSTNGRVVYQYFLKIVSTEFRHLKNIVYTNQYSVTQNEMTLRDGVSGLPGVFFNIEISPMHIIYQESRPAFSSLVTGLLAIVGGIFTVAGLIDRVVYKAERAYKKKMELGKTL